jgi:transposase-like protein
MKSMSKQQLADCAGVSRRTLMRWCKRHWEELEQLGLGPNAKVLSPKICKYIIEHYDIDV